MQRLLHSSWWLLFLLITKLLMDRPELCVVMCTISLAVSFNDLKWRTVAVQVVVRVRPPLPREYKVCLSLAPSCLSNIYSIKLRMRTVYQAAFAQLPVWGSFLGSVRGRGTMPCGLMHWL